MEWLGSRGWVSDFGHSLYLSSATILMFSLNAAETQRTHSNRTSGDVDAGEIYIAALFTTNNKVFGLEWNWQRGLRAFYRYSFCVALKRFSIVWLCSCTLHAIIMCEQLTVRSPPLKWCFCSQNSQHSNCCSFCGGQQRLTVCEHKDTCHGMLTISDFFFFYLCSFKLSTARIPQ